MSETKQSYCMNATEEHDILQLMRGFAILLVAIQHSVVLYFNSNASMVFIAVCVFIDVHIFMFVSGYLFQKKCDEYQKKGIKRFATKKFKSLGVPYLFWESVFFFGAYILYRLPFSGGISLMNALGFQKLSLPQIFVGLLTFRYSYVQLYWFLFALFWVFILNFALLKYSGKIEIIALVCLFVLFSVLAVVFKSDEHILLKISRSFLTFGFGRLFQKFRLEKAFYKNLIVLIASVFVLYFVYRIPVSFQNEYLGTTLASLRISAIGIVGILFFFNLSSYLSAYKSIITKTMMILGNYSLPIYLLHNPWIVHTSNIVFKKLSVPSHVGNVLSITLGLTIPILLYKYVIKKSALLSGVMLGIQNKTE